MKVGSRTHRRHRHALVMGSFAVVMVCCIGLPAEARSARYIQRAQKCAQELDSSCVIRLLGARQPKSANAAAHWRLLAGALARVGEHPRAQAAFVAWLKLSPEHQIAKASVPKVVWQDYQAAWLSVRSGQLDLDPRVQRRAYVPDTSTSVLPILPPPPRSSRDKARDTLLSLQSSAALESSHVIVGGELSVGIEIKPSIQVAIVGFGAVAAQGPATLLAGIALSGRWHPIQSGSHRLGLVAEVGGAIANRNQNNSSALFDGGLHYQWRPNNSVVGLELSLIERVYWLDDQLQTTHCIRIGPVFVPGGKP